MVAAISSILATNSSVDDEIYCAKRICDLGASAARIYPTLVFKSTELENLTVDGKYVPLSCDEAVDRSTQVLKIFIENNVTCIRIGLSDSENLHSDETFLAGPNEPSIGEMVKSRLYFDILCDKLHTYTGKSVVIECATGKISQVIGNKRKNIDNLKNKFELNHIKVIENTDLTQYEIKVKEEAICV